MQIKTNGVLMELQKVEITFVLDSLKAEAFDRLCKAAKEKEADFRSLILAEEQDFQLQIEQRKKDEQHS